MSFPAPAFVRVPFYGCAARPAPFLGRLHQVALAVLVYAITDSPLATGLGGVNQLAVDGDNVYWTEYEVVSGSGAVKSVPRTGGSVTVLASGTPSGSTYDVFFPQGIVLDDTYVYWGELDFLVVDMPPGTGDAQLTLAQRVPMSGAVIVTTPQDVALIDARKGLAMFKKLNVPVIGIVENMSGFVCPHCGESTDVFKHGGGERTADLLGTAFLGRIPLDPAIVIGGDAGVPIVVAEAAEEGPHHRAFSKVARAVADEVEARAAARQPLSIV